MKNLKSLEKEIYTKTVLDFVMNTNTLYSQQSPEDAELFNIFSTTYCLSFTSKVEEKFNLDNSNFKLTEEEMKDVQIKALLDVQVEIITQEGFVEKNFDIEKMKNVLVVTPLGLMQGLTQEMVDGWNY